MYKLSLIIPVFNEAEAIPIFLERIEELRNSIIGQLGDDASIEMVFVNDGSRDSTAKVITDRAATRTGIKLVNLSRNFGKEAALSAGLHYSTGDAVIPLDVDLQDPPEVILQLLEHWKAGAHVVNAKRTNRGQDSVLKRISARAFYWIMGKLADYPIHANVGDFRLLDRRAVDVLNQMSEATRFNKGLFSWIGFNVATVEYSRPERSAGESKWSFSKLWSLAVDGITSSTTLPLRIWTYLGAVVALLAIAYAMFLIIYTLVTGGDTPGYASLMVAVLFLGGLNLLSLGMIGEYLGRVAIEVRGRPLYIVESTEGF